MIYPSGQPHLSIIILIIFELLNCRDQQSCSQGLCRRAGFSKLIVALLALRSTDVFNGHTVFRTVFELFMELVVNAVEFVAIAAGGIREVDLGSAVAIDTPAHAQVSELFDLIHFLDRPVTGLALDLAGADVLCVAEEYMVRQVVDFYPFDRFAGLCIFLALGIVAGIAIEFLNFLCTIDFGSVFAKQFGSGIGIDRGMTVHTHVQGRDRSMLALPGIAVAVQTADLVGAGVYFMGVEDRLFRLISFGATEPDSALCEQVTTPDKQQEDNQHDINLISVERDGFVCRNPFFVVGEFFQTAVHLEQDQHDDREDQGQDTVKKRAVAAGFGSWGRTGSFGSGCRCFIRFYIL